MKPIFQTKLHIKGKQRGNCMRAVFASLLELSIDEVPPFEDMPDSKYFPKLLDWLESIGFYLLQWDEEIYLPVFYIANGISPRGVSHSVVYFEEKMVHDPHPSGLGINTITSVWVLLPINPVFNSTMKG
uniref:Uncharacterized protein n=1 Tax=viral metagenome TaxID=1070528 RepID=A0A6M3JS73_9ZZZZ